MWKTKPFYGQLILVSGGLWYVTNGTESYKEKGTVKYYNYRSEAEEKAAQLNEQG